MAGSGFLQAGIKTGVQVGLSGFNRMVGMGQGSGDPNMYGFSGVWLPFFLLKAGKIERRAESGERFSLKLKLRIPSLDRFPPVTIWILS